MRARQGVWRVAPSPTVLRCRPVPTSQTAWCPRRWSTCCEVARTSAESVGGVQAVESGGRRAGGGSAPPRCTGHLADPAGTSHSAGSLRRAYSLCEEQLGGADAVTAATSEFPLGDVRGLDAPQRERDDASCVAGAKTTAATPSHRAKMPDLPCRNARLTVPECWTHRVEMPDSPFAGQRKTTVLLPYTSTRSSRCQRRPRARTRRSMSRPRRTMSATVSPWSTLMTSCSRIGPASRSGVT